MDCRYHVFKYIDTQTCHFESLHSYNIIYSYLKNLSPMLRFFLSMLFLAMNVGNVISAIREIDP
jgi:hypothetical protein